MQQPLPNSGSWGQNNEEDCFENENRLETAKQSTQGWVNDHENPWVNDCENPQVSTAMERVRPPEFQDRQWDFTRFTRGERFVYKPIAREEFEEVFNVQEITGQSDQDH